MRKVLYILGQFDDLDVEWLARVGRKRRLAPGEAVIRQGEPTRCVSILLEGHLEVVIAGLGRVAHLGPGEIVGEMSFVDSAPPSATVSADGEAVVLEVAKRDIEDKTRTDQGFGFRFYKAIALFLADRLRTTQQQQRKAAGADADLESEAVQVDELDEKLLDTLSLAGDRFDRLLRRLAGQPG
jgi:CRP-like cAMP-binding protein